MHNQIMMERHLSHTRGCSLVVEDEYIVLMLLWIYQKVSLAECRLVYRSVCCLYRVFSMYVCIVHLGFILRRVFRPSNKVSGQSWPQVPHVTCVYAPSFGP